VTSSEPTGFRRWFDPSIAHQNSRIRTVQSSDVYPVTTHCVVTPTKRFSSRRRSSAATSASGQAGHRMIEIHHCDEQKPEQCKATVNRNVSSIVRGLVNGCTGITQSVGSRI
jgi:hypothetical protein